MTIHKALFLVIALVLTPFLQAQSVAELRSQLKNAESDTAKARLNGLLAWELKFINNKEATKLADEELKLAGNNALLLADGYRTKALVCIIENKLPEGLELYGRCLENARLAKSDYYEASCYSLIAGLYQDMGDYDRSLQYYFDGLKVAEKGHNTKMTGTLCNNIASVYGSTGGQAALALRYYKRALNEAVTLKSYAFAQLITANMAGEYMSLHKNDSAELMIRASENYGALSGKRAYEYASSLTNIGDIYEQLGKPGPAETCLKEAIVVMDSLKRPINVLAPITSLCKLYIQQNKMAAAEKLDNRLLKDAANYHAKAYLRDGYKIKSDLARLKHKDAMALKYYEEFNRWDDSVSNDAKMQSIANVQSRAELAQKELEVQYETKKKTQENQILKLQNNSLRNLVAAAVVVLLLIILLVFFILRISRTRQRLNLELTEKNKLIEKQSQEKDTLMLEIHHRVKNNLQIVSSLLNLQANSMHDETAIAALRESQNRVKSIALIHQKLYAREELSAILLEEYINELSINLKSVFNAGQISILSAVYPPHLKLDMDTSIPLSVILNELITNAIKYAQINKPGGQIHIEITDNLNGTCTLIFSDNGIGMPPGFDFKTATTLGMRIVYELTRQMRGTLTSTGVNGVKFTLVFPMNQTKK